MLPILSVGVESGNRDLEINGSNGGYKKSGSEIHVKWKTRNLGLLTCMDLVMYTVFKLVNV